MTRKGLPFEFVLELLAKLSPTTKPMFGAHGIYVNGKIVFIVRLKETVPEDNGVWLATTGEHHASRVIRGTCVRSHPARRSSDRKGLQGQGRKKEIGENSFS